MNPQDHRSSAVFAQECRAILAKNGLDASRFNFVEKPLHEQQPGLPFGTPSVVWMGNPWCYRGDLTIKGSSTNCSPLFEVDWVWDTVLRDFPGCRKRDLIADQNTILQHGVYIQGAGLEGMKGISRVLQLCGSTAMLIHLGDEYENNVDGPWQKNQDHEHVPQSVMKGDPLHDSWEKGLYSSTSFPIIIRQYWNKALQEKFPDKVIVMPLGYSQSFYGVGWHPVNERDPGRDRLARLRDGSPYTDPDLREADRALKRDHGQHIPVLSRKHPWAFFGNAQKSTRRKMADSMKRIPHGYFHSAHGFFGNMTMPEDVQVVMADSQFCPAPTGWVNPDSFRFSEAMETGCFPLVDSWSKLQDKDPKFRTYWEDFLTYEGQLVGLSAKKIINRFVFLVDDWNDAPELIRKLHTDTADLAARHRELLSFWSLWKKNLSLRAKCGFCQRVSSEACLAEGSNFTAVQSQNPGSSQDQQSATSASTASSSAVASSSANSSSAANSSVASSSFASSSAATSSSTASSSANSSSANSSIIMNSTQSFAVVRTFAPKDADRLSILLTEMNGLDPCSHRFGDQDLVLVQSNNEKLDSATSAKLANAIQFSPLQKCFRKVLLVNTNLDGGQNRDLTRECELFHHMFTRDFPFLNSYASVFFMDMDVHCIRKDWVDFVARMFSRQVARQSLVIDAEGTTGHGSLTGFYAVSNLELRKQMNTWYYTELRCDSHETQTAASFRKRLAESLMRDEHLKTRYTSENFMSVGTENTHYRDALKSPNQFFYYGPAEVSRRSVNAGFSAF